MTIGSYLAEAVRIVDEYETRAPRRVTISFVMLVEGLMITARAAVKTHDEADAMRNIETLFIAWEEFDEKAATLPDAMRGLCTLLDSIILARHAKRSGQLS